MAELEQQIAEHNILQKEIEAYGQQLRSLVGPVGELGACHIPGQPQPLFLQSEPELDRLDPGDRGRWGMAAQILGGHLPAPHLLWGCFSPWSRQDAATIRSQYRDLLVSRREGRTGWLRVGVGGRPDPARGQCS